MFVVPLYAFLTTTVAQVRNGANGRRQQYRQFRCDGRRDVDARLRAEHRWRVGRSDSCSSSRRDASLRHGSDGSSTWPATEQSRVRRSEIDHEQEAGRRRSAANSAQRSSLITPSAVRRTRRRGVVRQLSHRRRRSWPRIELRRASATWSLHAHFLTMFLPCLQRADIGARSRRPEAGRAARLRRIRS